ncbi:glycosyltransferase family 2 protein [Conexibacter sp. SYSU D00693]|uniref:glycosyltransferase family 2 protein n=1 Tax=Conexibacter sp. SYSU D00693 TaxID=2812560 RepID=UPI00196B3A11|nr:glycosyltransferase family 2 protein [Conexibacter sp. SYSU D00693]
MAVQAPGTAGAVQEAAPQHSVVIPVYGNEESIPHLLERLAGLVGDLAGGLEVVFVVDGSPDRSAALLAELLPAQPFLSRLVLHSRNFGAFAAVRTGMERATGRFIGVMAADLQEPPELMRDFFAKLAADEHDIVVGVRRSREDPALTSLNSRIFWALYRRMVQPETPVGGVDVFACTAEFRDHLTDLEESNSSLIGLALWLGFRRGEVEYDRAEREHGTSGWTLRKRLKYLSDSVFSFTDLPIRLLLGAGLAGIVASLLLAAVVAVARASGAIDVPGYAATIMVIAFFAALNLAGLGIIGAYVWRGFENTKGRPGAVVMAERDYVPEQTR